MNTGLYVSCEKSNKLLQIVKNLLQHKFSVKAVCGPPLPSGRCQILLQAIHNTQTPVNFTAAKYAVEIYLDVLKEPRANVAEKQPEVIDIEDEDKALECTESVVVMDDSFVKTNIEKRGLCKSADVEVIDVDVCEKTGWFQQRKTLCNIDNKDEKEAAGSGLAESKNFIDGNNALGQDSARLSAGFSDDVIVIDSVKKNHPKLLCVENSGSSKPSQTLGCGGVKRRKSVEIIELDDDDVIILDDSFQEPKHLKASTSQSHYQGGSLTVTAKGESRTVVAASSDNIVIDLDSSGYDSNSSGSSKRLDSLLQNSGFDCVIDPTGNLVSNKLDSHETSAQNTNTSSSNSAKKPSKFSYKRPAHLISPLTQNVSGTCASSENSSSSGMSNIYNPNANAEEKRSGLRPIVIDGNNVGVSHGNGQFSVKGIQICINYFEKRGHRHIKAFIPQYRRRRDVHDILEKMERQGTVVITPSRRVEGKTVAPYDDRYIVQYAAEVGGIIVTTDHYRDLLEENPIWKQTIQNRLLMFNWVEDLLMFPVDPMGRNGPTLDDFLKFPDQTY